MAEFIECRDCDSRSCTGCNTYILSQMLHAGKLDGIMDEHHTILAVDVAPVVPGRWEERKRPTEHLVCSACCRKNFMRVKSDYCPNCGAHMKDGAK